MPSFDAVNYTLRPNKTVERKIVFSSLQSLSRIIDLSNHLYVGFGSLWFVDYLMAHRSLGIKSMVSIERDQIGRRRADFNRPLACIEVVPGESTEVIPTLGLEARESVVWFDYDSSIDGPTLADIGLLAPRCAINSVLIVTINAKKDELIMKDEDGKELDAETSLRRIAGDLVPTPLQPKRLQASNYTKLLCEILTNQFRSKTAKSGRSETFVKLFDLTYSDGTPMVTVGGILTSVERAAEISALTESPDWLGSSEEIISVPPLTAKEKMALDRLLPCEEAPTVEDVHKIGFALKAEQIRTYHRYYRQYPLFGEIL